MKLVLFDWNGTLLDDVPNMYDALIKKVFDTCRLPPPSLVEYFTAFAKNGNWFEIFDQRNITLSRSEVLAIYQPEYELLSRNANLYPKVKETLEKLGDKGLRLGLISAQTAKLVIPFLEKFDIGKFFSYIKFDAFDKTISIQKILQNIPVREVVEPEDCCYVGDAPSDIGQANNAGVVSIAYYNGHIPMELLEKEKPRFLIHKIGDLEKIIDIC